MATKHSLNSRYKQRAVLALPWLLLAIFVAVIYGGSQTSLVKWFDSSLQDLVRWPSSGQLTDQDARNTANQIQNYSSESLSQARSQRLLPGSWQDAKVKGQISSTHHWLLIDRGSKSGLRSGMPVVINGYFAGSIWQVNQSSATVILLSDPDFSVAAVVNSTGKDGLLEAKNGGVVFDHVLGSPQISGKPLITSGNGGIVPAGLPLGQITSQISSSPSGESQWGVDYPSANGAIWVEIYLGEK